MNKGFLDLLFESISDLITKIKVKGRIEILKNNYRASNSRAYDGIASSPSGKIFAVVDNKNDKDNFHLLIFYISSRGLFSKVSDIKLRHTAAITNIVKVYVGDLGNKVVIKILQETMKSPYRLEVYDIVNFNLANIENYKTSNASSVYDGNNLFYNIKGTDLHVIVESDIEQQGFKHLSSLMNIVYSNLPHILSDDTIKGITSEITYKDIKSVKSTTLESLINQHTGFIRNITFRDEN